MSDADIMWDSYSANVQEWEMARVLSELKMLQRDKDAGQLNTSGYDRAKKLLEDRIYDIINNHDSRVAYDRAMKGI